MPFVPFTNVIKLEAVFTQDGQRVENVYHYQWNQAVTPAVMAGLAADFVTKWDANMKSLVSSAVSLVEVATTDLTTDVGPVYTYTTGLPIQGTNASAAEPNNVTVAIKWLTTKRGRSYRGRTYHIGLTESQVTNNTLTEAALTALGNAYSILSELDYSGTGASMVVASRFMNKQLRDIGEATEVVSKAIDSTVDSQRRRLPGRGR